MNIILFGPPGAGKGTQSDTLVKDYNLYKVSTGDLLRDEIKKKSSLGNKIKIIIDKGQLVSDDITNDLIQSLISNSNYKNRLIFVCTIILIGHWINSYLLFAPGTLNDHGHLGLLEVGLGIGFLGLFLKIVLTSLSKRNIEIGNHPFLDESKHLHT